MSISPKPRVGSDTFGIIHLSYLGGHRQAYIDLFGTMFGLQASVGQIRLQKFTQLVKAPAVLFGTLDEDLVGFAIVALSRGFLGRRTCGLFLHANTCFGPGLKARLKRLLFGMLSRAPQTRVISIIPELVLADVNRVSSGSTHDPQFWDQLDNLPKVDMSALSAIMNSTRDRVTLAFVGGMTNAKAFPRLAWLYSSSPRLRERVQLVIAGPCQDGSESAVAALKLTDAIVLDRFVSDGEMAAVYEAADWIWTSYAPGYDQASGIFGRAVQWGRPVLVREDSSTLAAYVRALDHPAVFLSADDDRAILQLMNLKRRGGLAKEVSERSRATCLEWKREFEEMIQDALRSERQ